MRSLLVLVGFLFFTGVAQAAILKGRVTDENGEALPFATLYIRNSTTGTATNEQGYYQINLAPGTYQLVFQYVGYKAKIETVEIGTADVERNVTLQLDIFNLKEVEVKANEKDPAYAIVKAAIARRKYHLQEVLAYNCRVYTKGLGRLSKVPNRVLGVKINDLKTGVVYFSETVSELSFRQPATMHERMISSKVSGSQKDFSFNRASRATFSFYENLLKVPGLSERGFVSPIAGNALLYYRYKLIGATQENGRFINKIKVTPIRRNDPAFEGFIYIIDDSWRLHSLDLKLAKAQIEYADTVRIRQSFGPVQDDVWMLFSQKLTTQFDSFGFAGDGYFTTVYSNYKIQPRYPKPIETPTVPTPATVDKPQPVIASKTRLNLKKKEFRKQQKAKADELFGLKKNKNELMVVEKDANTRDSTYWESIRPIPLTQEEQKDYVVKDSLEVVQQSKPVQDSLDKIRNNFRPQKLIIDGYSYRNSFKKYSFYIPPFLKIYENNAALQYNTVEGVAVNVGFTYRKWVGEEDSRKGFTISPMVRYGFANERFGAKITATYAYEPATQSSITLSGGRFTEQFSSTAPVHTFWNALYTLLREQNFLKLYQKTYVRLNHGFELANGLNIFSSLEFADRQPLENTATATLKDWPKEQFTSNVPVNAELTNAAFPRHQAFIGTAVLQYRPGLKYITRPNEKWRLGSKYPTLSLGYLKGFLGIFGSDVDYNRLTFTINDRVELGLIGTSAYSVQVGGHPNNRRMYFMDYRHFNGNRTLYAGGFGGFQLLDYYLYSTNNNYLVANFRHEFNGFIFNKIPLFRKLKLQEVASLNYLRTQQSKNYLEVGVGVEHIFKILRVDFITSFRSKEKSGAGFRVGFGF